MSANTSAQFTISEMIAGDLDETTEMRMQSWRDTYPNDEYGVTLEWVDQQHAQNISEDKREDRFQRFLKGKESGTLNAWVAKDSEGRTIGAATPFVEEDGTQRVGSLYVAKDWNGKGIGAELMQRIIEWFDPTKPIVLEVASYNERAKNFYKKWGFEEVQGSEKLHRDIMPVVTMVRKGKGK